MTKTRVFALIAAITMLFSALACAGGGHLQTAEPSSSPTALLMNSATPTVPVTQFVETAAPTPTPIPYEPITSWPCISPGVYPKVDGSTATIPLAEGLRMLLTGCSREEAEASIDFSTTDFSYHALAEGNADFLLVYEPADATKSELDPFNKMTMIPIGLDALVFIVNETNPVQSISIEDIQGIYTGRITNWKDLGGNDVPIVPFQRPDLSGSQTLMKRLCMKGIPMMEPSEDRISQDMADIIEDVAMYDNTHGGAIGYSVYYYAKNMYTQPGVRFIAVECSMPSDESINYMSYPLINPFYAVLPKNRFNSYAYAIVQWLRSESGQLFIKSCGYVPIMIFDD